MYYNKKKKLCTGNTKLLCILAIYVILNIYQQIDGVLYFTEFITYTRCIGIII